MNNVAHAGKNADENNAANPINNPGILNTSFGRAARSLALCAAATGVGSAMLPQTAGAALIFDMGLDPQHRALAQRFLVGAAEPLNQGGGAGAIRRVLPGLGTASASMTFINSSWGLTAKHVVEPFMSIQGLTINVFTGSNYFTNSGPPIAIDQIILYPNGNADLALLRFAVPQPQIQRVVFGTSYTGETVTGVGYGRYGSPATGALVQDGNARGFRGVNEPDNVGFAGLDPSRIGASEVGFIPIPMADLAGRGLNGDSGSPMFNSAGELVGINIQGTLSTSSLNGVTLFQRTDHPEVFSWIFSNTQAVVPEPSGSLVVAAGLMLGATRRRRD